MILTTCAACAAPLAHNAPRCVRCWTRYCDSTCQGDVVAAVWAALARVGVTGSGDVAADVFDLGVDSLGLAEVVGALEEAYGEGCVSVDEVFDNATVADIAAAVARGATTTGAVVVEKAAPPIDRGARGAEARPDRGRARAAQRRRRHLVVGGELVEPGELRCRSTTGWRSPPSKPRKYFLR